MARDKDTAAPPRRKEPGILGNFFRSIMATLWWLFISLIVSILIEWGGIAFFWPEEGSEHSRMTFTEDYGYLNSRVAYTANTIVKKVEEVTLDVTLWISGVFNTDRLRHWLRSSSNENDGLIQRLVRYTYTKYQPYVDSVPNTVQIFFVRLAIIIFSLPSFLMFGLIGLVDGLVERDLRRWGGGRESSVVYNIARKSIFRFFIGACVIYLSFPISVAPAWVIIPFAMAFGFSIRVAFERFKKYF